MNVLLDQLDISWLDPDPSMTLDILNIILTFVKSFDVNEDVVKTVDEIDDEGALTKLIIGETCTCYKAERLSIKVSYLMPT